MGGTEPPDIMLPKAKHTSSSILSYRIGLDPIATSYLVGWISPLLTNVLILGTLSFLQKIVLAHLIKSNNDPFLVFISSKNLILGITFFEFPLISRARCLYVIFPKSGLQNISYPLHLLYFCKTKIFCT